MQRTCRICCAKLNAYNTNSLCSACQEKTAEATTETTHYTINDLMRLLGLVSEEQVRRMSRAGKIPGRIPGIRKHLFRKEVVDSWIRSGSTLATQLIDIGLREASKLCRRGDHSFFDDEKLDGRGYLSKGDHYIGDNTLTLLTRKTCAFCGYQTVSPLA